MVITSSSTTFKINNIDVNDNNSFFFSQILEQTGGCIVCYGDYHIIVYKSNIKAKPISEALCRTIQDSFSYRYCSKKMYCYPLVEFYNEVPTYQEAATFSLEYCRMRDTRIKLYIGGTLNHILLY